MATKIQFLVVAVSAFSATAVTINHGKQPVNTPVANAPVNTKAPDNAKLSKFDSDAKGVLQDAMSLELPLFKKKYKRSAEFEKDIGELIMSLSKNGQGATPMANSVREIARIIREDMLDAVMTAHTTDQDALDSIAAEVHNCDASKESAMTVAAGFTTTYEAKSDLHKPCRVSEAALFAENHQCLADRASKKEIKELNCRTYSDVAAQVSNQQKNIEVVEKSAEESVESYVSRMTLTLCGHTGVLGNGGGLEGGLLDQLLKAKEKCETATSEFNTKSTECKTVDDNWKLKRGECDAIQKQMDEASCKAAVDSKDACEAYAECYTIKKQQDYKAAEERARTEEVDRKAEWKGLKKMECLITAFEDGKVEDKEVEECKDVHVDNDHLTITWPSVPSRQECEVPEKYPTTAAYKQAEYEPLPTQAKGQLEANECTGLQEINTEPAEGSPGTCVCERVTMAGSFAPGALVKCTGCWDVSKAEQMNSCPAGTKLFAPRSRADWDTFIKSTQPSSVRAPNLIIDVTRPVAGCYHCGSTAPAFNSEDGGDTDPAQRWVTSDGAPWWIRGNSFGYPHGDYQANCYLNIDQNPTSPDEVSFKDEACSYHSSAYYCQPKFFPLKPKDGSPDACHCKRVQLNGPYSSELLVKCERCLDVSKSNQKNSCPVGTKLFSPTSREDWKTFLASAEPLRAPNWIIDITRPTNGCGGCTEYAMNSEEGSQATWQTSDGSAWWLRSTVYTQPDGDGYLAPGAAESGRRPEYVANCYMDLWQNPATEDGITFDDDECNAHSRGYYCQSVRPQTTTTTTTVLEDPPPAGVTWKGCTSWAQQCQNSNHQEQETLMDEACHNEYPGSRAATIDELVDGSISEMPSGSNPCDKHTILKCGATTNEQCHGTYYTGDSRQCINPGGTIPTVFAPDNSWNPNCCMSTRSTMCVEGEGQTYTIQEVSTTCPDGKNVESRADCLSAHRALGLDSHVYTASVNVDTNVKGCFVNTYSNTLYFNSADEGEATGFNRPICKQ